MKIKQHSKKQAYISGLLALLALFLLAGFGAYWYHHAALTDITNSTQLSTLLENTTGHTDAQVQNIKSEGNLAVVSYRADDRQGILLLERADGQDDGRCRLLDWEESGAGLHTYETSLNGVVNLTVLYGENTQEAKTVTLLGDSTSETFTLDAGSVLEISLNPGASSDSQTELLYCGG